MSRQERRGHHRVVRREKTAEHNGGVCASWAAQHRFNLDEIQTAWSFIALAAHRVVQCGEVGGRQVNLTVIHKRPHVKGRDDRVAVHAQFDIQAVGLTAHHVHHHRERVDAIRWQEERERHL